ncbi:hypothetical protein [Sinorhizobium americanum]|uniref:hypothetical protein n=1 Tax=Sinorhizobium americanum TaxID=194963 RepID=UPI000691A0F5|nr:hypothetical protein [Sinorhizobium americanum]
MIFANPSARQKLSHIAIFRSCARAATNARAINSVNDLTRTALKSLPSELNQTIRIVGIVFVERLVQYLLRLPRFYADLKTALRRQHMIEPRRQQPEYDAPGVRGVWSPTDISPAGLLPVFLIRTKSWSFSGGWRREKPSASWQMRLASVATDFTSGVITSGLPGNLESRRRGRSDP